MNYEFVCEEGFLIMKLSGKVGVNERLSVKKRLAPYLERSCKKVIVHLQGLGESEGGHILGVLNTIKKEFELLGGEVKLCYLNPELIGYFRENRLDQLFEIVQSVEQAKKSSKEKNHGV
ncbi:MAG TPA: STAS domain-containing protein [Thermodesulfobacteriota bacterium]|nr:STAS domain-containing protein [Thermodesulfobacteriota bacterium]